jgi:hypothetical protein
MMEDRMDLTLRLAKLERDKTKRENSLPPYLIKLKDKYKIKIQEKPPFWKRWLRRFI